MNGYGLGEVHHGGYAERARVKGDWLIRLPETISTFHAMAIGTAGYTAMLCVLALEKAGITPDRGDVLVTGAAGGVGSIAIALLDKLGYRVVASSRRAKQEADYLQDSAQMRSSTPASFSRPVAHWGRSAGPGRWIPSAAARSPTYCRTSNTMAQWRLAALAQGSDLPATVLPFILRDVTLAGVELVWARREKRDEAWHRLSNRPRSRKARQPGGSRKTGRCAIFGGRNPHRKDKGSVVIDL